MTAPARFRRVVVSVSGETSAGVYASAAEIAHQLSADLAGLFIEDESVFGIADLPFAAEIARGGTARPLRRDEIERAFRVGFSGARRRFEAAARTVRIRATIARQRGAVAAIVTEAAGPGDILIVIEPGRAIDRVCSINASYLAAALRSRSSVLYAPEAALAWRGGVAAYLDGAADRQVLATAARFAAARGAPLTVIARASDEAWRGTLDEIMASLESAGPMLATPVTAGAGLAATLAAAPGLDSHLIIAARTPDAVASPQALRALAARRRAPLLLVWPDAPGA